MLPFAFGFGFGIPDESSCDFARLLGPVGIARGAELAFEVTCLFCLVLSSGAAKGSEKEDINS